MASPFASVHTPLTIDDLLDITATAGHLVTEHGMAPLFALDLAATRFRNARVARRAFIEPAFEGSTTEGDPA